MCLVILRNGKCDEWQVLMQFSYCVHCLYNYFHLTTTFFALAVMLQSPSIDTNVPVSVLSSAFFFDFIYMVSSEAVYLRNSAVVDIALVFLLCRPMRL